MTPTRLYEHAKEGAKDIVDLDEIVDTYRRLDSGAIDEEEYRLLKKKLIG